jgi:formylglycine-generating enzyme required for sulfatase activity
MITVPAGSFIMGDGVAYCGVDEREVTLTHDFYLGQHEVTNQEYVEALQWALDHNYVMATSSSVTDNLDGSVVELLDLDLHGCAISYSGGAFSCVNPTHPVREVTWYGAAAYCDWLSLASGVDRAYEHSGNWLCNDHNPYEADGYRLPTDAEWEYAAQCPDDRIYPWGDTSPSCNLANYGHDCVGWTSPVGSCPDGDSYLGFSDLAGNVWEWCNDWWRCDLGGGAQENPIGDPTGTYHVVHGGSWLNPDYAFRCAYRLNGPPSATIGHSGFRVARTVDP